MGRVIYGIFERMWKHAVVLHFKAFSWHLLGGIKIKHEEPQDNYENNQQDALYWLIYYSKSALHVSGGVFAHNQEQLTVFAVSGVPMGHQPAATWVNTTRYCKYSQVLLPDDGRKHRLKHVEMTWNNKLIYIMHLVGYFHSCITMYGFMNIKPQDSLCSRKYSEHASPKVLVRKVTNSANMLNKYIFKLSQFCNFSGLGIVVFVWFKHSNWNINPSNTKLNPICNLLVDRPILHISRVRVNNV
jgi:hypothetical protein